MSAAATGRVVALCGGVGGAKLALGLSHVVPDDRLTVIVNTGDDFHHYGWLVCPDIDTVMYTLGGVVNTQTGWGRANESWRFMEALRQIGGETWFNLGDSDLATHAVRTQKLTGGARLTEVTRELAGQFGIRANILPMSDDPVRTMVDTDEGLLPFQRYFVGRQCAPRVKEIHMAGASEARMPEEVLAALRAPDLQAVVICPSNPYLSLDPMLAIPGFRQAIMDADAPVVAVSPIVGGKAIKGPLAKLMEELGKQIEPQTVADHYDGLVDIFIADQQDRDQIIKGPKVHFTNTVMNDLKDRIALAREVLAQTVQPQLHWEGQSHDHRTKEGRGMGPAAR